ncbi:MAG: hypothetical protein A2X22_08510 [Bacteroidetes bacterium GWF2_49_14]|nr:MAG: hypothetical protein A2X22_08510 [Bacteroidetes bacterium GWF2_49_14]HBB92486.1 hypothetical protein [Bacteroidales bacterium]
MIIIRKRIKVFALAALSVAFICRSLPADAQEGMTKEVSVVRPYSPTIANAFKTRFIPKLDDSVQVPTHFEYFIQPARINPQLRIRELEASGFSAGGKEDLKHSTVSLGLGNYWTPMGKLSIHTLRNPKNSLGIDLSHISSQGSVKMPDDRKIYAGYANNDVRLYSQSYMKNATFSSEFYFREDHHFLYGYTTDTIADPTDPLKRIPLLPWIDRATQRDSVPLQRFIVIGSKLSMASDQKSRNGWQYRVDGGYDLTLANQDEPIFLNEYDDNAEVEHFGQLDIAISKDYDKISFGGEIGADYVNRNHPLDTLNYAVAYADPWMGFEWKYIKLLAGPKVAMDRNAAKFWFFPRMKLEINITNLLVPYIGLDGRYENHTLLSVSRENPYIADNVDINPTIHRFIAYGGLRGRFTPLVAFNLAVSWEDANNLMFFAPDIANPHRNTFNLIYDNGSILQAGGEVSLRQSDNLSFILKGNYYQYQLDSLPAAWHKPGWDLNFTTRYAWKKKLMVKAELFMLGKYSVPEPDPGLGTVKVLDGLIDINLAAEYRFTPWMSAFAQVNNLISDKYFIWQNYPMQGINFIGGLSWIF